MLLGVEEGANGDARFGCGNNSSVDVAVAFLLFDAVMKFIMDKLPPEALEAENGFPSSSGYVGIEPPAIFIIYLLVFMALALFVSVFLQTRSRGQPRS